MGYFDILRGSASSELGFTDDCHLIEMFNANSFWNTVKTRKYRKALRFSETSCILKANHSFKGRKFF